MSGNFLIAHYFLWTYPKNSKQTASRFQICDKYTRGEHLWKWIAKIAALKEKKIVWDRDLDAANTAIFCVSIDGTDFRVWEKKHPLLNQDRTQYSKKFAHGALKYEIAMSVFKPKCVWISEQYRGGEHDMTIFRQQLKHKIKPWKKAIADRGYQTSREDEKMLSQPNHRDSKELNKFKSRARLRHETFNGRLKKFEALQNTFRHGAEKHKLVMEAVCVTVQYQMDNGSSVFDV